MGPKQSEGTTKGLRVMNSVDPCDYGLVEKYYYLEYTCTGFWTTVYFPYDI